MVRRQVSGVRTCARSDGRLPSRFRLVKETGLPQRRMFTDVEGLQDWLGEVLDDAERARLSEFLRHP